MKECTYPRQFQDFGLQLSYEALHKKCFPLRIFSVNVSKSAVFLRIWSHLLKKFLMENLFFLCIEDEIIFQESLNA